MKIAMTSIPVQDVKKAFEFYTEKLGFVEHMYYPEQQLAIVKSPQDLDGVVLLLEPAKGTFYSDFQEEVHKMKMPVIIFSTKDIDLEYKTLKEKGVEFTKAPTKQDWGIETIFDDTCGNYIQIMQAQ